MPQFSTYFAPVPVMPSQISGRKFDLSGLLKYAKEKNISPAKLSEKEKSEFIH